MIGVWRVADEMKFEEKVLTGKYWMEKPKISKVIIQQILVQFNWMFNK